MILRHKQTHFHKQFHSHEVFIFDNSQQKYLEMWKIFFHSFTHSRNYIFLVKKNIGYFSFLVISHRQQDRLSSNFRGNNVGSCRHFPGNFKLINSAICEKNVGPMSVSIFHLLNPVPEILRLAENMLLTPRPRILQPKNQDWRFVLSN